MTTLSASTLPELSARLPVPEYDRSRLRVGIVHFGVGGFHRSHQAMYLDRLMSQGQGLEWAVCGVGLLPGDRQMAEVMAAQDCLYTLTLKHPDGALEPRVIGSHVKYLYGPADPAAVLAQMTDPAVRIVSLTVTEGGYHYNPVTGELDADAAELQHDLSEPEAPASAFGYILAALRRRRAAGHAPFTVLSCDNIRGNGELTRRMLVAFARLQDAEFAHWVDEHVAFPSGMVDRITPVTSEADREALTEQFGVQDRWPVVAEPYTQWVLEDHFPTGRPAWEQVGVQLTHDVIPYELMKLRLLNASHQALCYLGYLSGYRYAHEVCSDPLFVDFLLRYMEQEATPTLQPVPDIDLVAYRHQLIDRFANPEVRDTLARLCAESSDRIPTWLVPVITENLAAGGEIGCSALVVASWARYAAGVDEHGEPIDVVDRLRDQVMAAAAQYGTDELAFLRNQDLFGTLAHEQRFTEAYRRHLHSLNEVGARRTLEHFMTDVTS